MHVPFVMFNVPVVTFRVPVAMFQLPYQHNLILILHFASYILLT